MNRKQFIELLATKLGTTEPLANDIFGVVIGSIEECLLD
jgi:nucleoid DNA-binding protein